MRLLLILGVYATRCALRHPPGPFISYTSKIRNERFSGIANEPVRPNGARPQPPIRCANILFLVTAESGKVMVPLNMRAYMQVPSVIYLGRGRLAEPKR